ncbi:unnamed protein product [Euphydryas editha]|uniref:FP protein C-terminal domain-containing protein n=1 Tax=Euphydryas editha TaxID=104508 RepID=A0AAU9TCB4_EUPED|nr:unnamed protein product [Euphydryas editha]
MSSATKICSGCKHNLPKKDYLICVTCKHGYDLLCASLTPKRFSLMDAEAKKKWNCQECLSKRPKTDNSDTPIRIANRPSGSTIESILSQEDENVTMRIKKQYSSVDNSSSFVTVEMLRRIVKEEMTETISCLVSENLANLNHQISGFEQSLSFISKQYDTLVQAVNEKNEIIKNLASDNQNLFSQVRDLKDRLSQVEQSLRIANVEITGVPEHKSENLVKTVVQLGKIVESPIAESDITHVTRIAKFNKESKRPRSIIVKLQSQNHRDELLAAVSRFNKKNRDKKLNTEHLGIGGRSQPVYVSEHLTLTKKHLHAATRIKAREAGFKFVWIRDGRIFARKSETSPAIYVKDEETLKLII